MLVRSGGVDVIVIDSVAALVPKAEIEGEMGDQLPGLQARLMSQALRKLAGNIKRAGTLVIFINQIRMKIGVMFGNPETTTGGNALKFYASVRSTSAASARSRRRGSDRQRNARQGRQEQGRAAVPRGAVRHPVRRGHLARGRDHRARRHAQDRRESPARGTPYSGEKIGQGKDNAREFLREHADIADEIEGKIRATVGVPLPGRLGLRRRSPRTDRKRPCAPAHRDARTRTPASVPS
jgi:recombination protein RecA